MTTKPARGGSRNGAGRTITELFLSLDAARTLRLVMKAQGMPYTKDNAVALVQVLIEAEWQRIDAALVHDSEADDA